MRRVAAATQHGALFALLLHPCAPCASVHVHTCSFHAPNRTVGHAAWHDAPSLHPLQIHMCICSVVPWCHLCTILEAAQPHARDEHCALT